MEGRKGRDREFYRDLLAAGNRLGHGNDRGITNGQPGEEGQAKKGGTGCQRNNADAKANKMPSGVAPINHGVYVPAAFLSLRRDVARRIASGPSIRSINKTCSANPEDPVGRAPGIDPG